MKQFKNFYEGTYAKYILPGVLLQSVLIQLAFFLMSLSFFYSLVRMVRRLGVEMIEEEPESENVEKLNEAVSRVRGVTAAGIRKVKSHAGLPRWLRRHPWHW